jgi:hypothetical protein
MRPMLPQVAEAVTRAGRRRFAPARFSSKEGR